jgi:hypothetical protein
MAKLVNVAPLQFLQFTKRMLYRSKLNEARQRVCDVDGQTVFPSNVQERMSMRKDYFGRCQRARYVLITMSACMVAIATAPPSEAQGLQLTPFVGWRYGGSFTELETGNDVTLDSSADFGLIVGIPWNKEHRSYLELIWSHQDADVAVTGVEPGVLGLDIDYLHLGGTVPFATPNKKLETLLSGGLGATYMQADIEGSSSHLFFSVSLAGGLRYHLSQRVALRFDLRGWYTITSSQGAVFCSGGCVIAVSGSGFGQIEATAGVQFSF